MACANSRAAKNQLCHPELVEGWCGETARGFTLVELLIAISILGTISIIVASLYVDVFRGTAKTNTQNQIYEDGRFILEKIAGEIRENLIDYDEYYNQNVVANTQNAPAGGPAFGLRNYGQNYGRYYSSFFNPGKDNALGFECNDNALHRNDRNCIPLRKTIDRNTGANPYTGKYRGAGQNDEDAFFGAIYYGSGQMPNRAGTPTPQGNAAREVISQEELYLISPDAKQKTILARERIGGTDQSPAYALSLLRMKGIDTDNDKIPDKFVCADEFQCVGGDDIPDVSGQIAPGRRCIGDQNDLPGELPRSRELELQTYNVQDACDSPSKAFSKDFVPVSPFTVNVKALKFIISPTEDPQYAFAEHDKQHQPRVTVVLTVAPNSERIGFNQAFQEFTLVETISSRVNSIAPAPLLAVGAP